MSKNAFIFPGQASQYVGMGKDLYENTDIGRQLFDKANDILGYDLKTICFEGPEEELKQTYVTQPAIFVHSVIIFELIKNKLSPQGVAGHSLGEYSALVAADSFDFENGLRLVKERSRLMYEAGQQSPGTMGALIGMSPEDVTQLCEDLSSSGIVQPANFNCPGQIAISGDTATVQRALEEAKNRGAKRAVELVVSGAFHSPLMEHARLGLESAIHASTIKDVTIDFYSNVTAGKVLNSSDISRLLLEQLTSPVRWQEIMQNMNAQGYDTFYEIGPGTVLKGLLKRIDRSISCTAVGSLETVNQIGEN